MPTYTWTIASAAGAECGYDGAAIRAGEPVQEISRPGLSRKLLRCERHAHGEVDWAQVDAARHAAEAADLAQRESMSTPLLSNGRVRSFRALSESVGDLFDPKAAAAGDRE